MCTKYTTHDSGSSVATHVGCSDSHRFDWSSGSQVSEDRCRTSRLGGGGRRVLAGDVEEGGEVCEDEAGTVGAATEAAAPDCTAQHSTAQHIQCSKEVVGE